MEEPETSPPPGGLHERGEAAASPPPQVLRRTFTVTRRLLGCGARGIVRLGYCDQTLEKVAVKVLQKSVVGSLDRERKVMDHLHGVDMGSGRFVRLIDVVESDDNDGEIHCVMNLVLGRELFDVCNEFSLCGMEETRARRITRRLFRYVASLHSYGIVHLDLKLENVILSSADRPTIVDFEFSRMHVDEDTGEPVLQTTFCGSLQYMAPEIVLTIPYDGTKADVWSCGVILFMLLTGTMPFSPLYDDSGDDDDSSEEEESEGDNLDVYVAIISNNPLFPRDMSASAVNLIRWMLTTDVKRRPSMEQVLQHMWLKERRDRLR